MSPPISQPRPFDVLEIDGADGVLTPRGYPRAVYYADDGGLVLFPAGGRRGSTLRMNVAEFAEADDGRAVALGALGTKLVLLTRSRTGRKRRRRSH